MKKNKTEFNRRDIKHMHNYFLEISKADYFINKFAELRKQLNIPIDGFAKKVKKLPGTMPVSGWKEFKKYSLKKEAYVDLGKRFKLNFWDWEPIFDSFLYYNSFKVKELDFFRSFNMCITRDLVLDKAFEGQEGEYIIDELKSFDDTYPIAIRISPYASKRSILEYVNNVYNNEIKPLQEARKDNKCKIGKLRLKDPDKSKRDDFILKNQNLKHKEIAELANNKYGGMLGYEDISKIIKKERKRRSNI